MEVILTRSPFFITIDEASQTGSKVELFIWHKGETEPATPTRTLTKSAPSPTQRENNYNIANYIKEYLNIIAPTTTTTVVEEDNEQWCYCKVKRYKVVVATTTLLDTTTYIGLNGYTDYIGGYNQSYTDNVLPLVSPKIKRYYHNTTGYSDGSYFNLLIQETSPNDTIELTYYDASGSVSSVVSLLSDDDYLYRVPYMLNDIDLINGGYVKIYNVSDATLITSIYSTPLCEPKYTPALLSFLNRDGGWQFLTFFKAKSESYESKSKDFALLPDAVDYNPLRGQSQNFNFVASRKIKINTGWVDENYSEIIQDLFNSETILLDNVPVQLKSSSFQFKTKLKDRVINYEFDFEYNFNQINNVQ